MLPICTVVLGVGGEGQLVGPWRGIRAVPDLSRSNEGQDGAGITSPARSHSARLSLIIQPLFLLERADISGTK